MEPKAGDVFCIYNAYLKKYTAVQVTKLVQQYGVMKAVLLSLNWQGDAPLTQSQLGQIQPLYKDFMYWNKGLHLCNVEPIVPSSFVPVGNTAPLSHKSTNTYHRGWGDGYDVYRQLLWERIPQSRRDAFKKAVKSEATAVLNGKVVPLSIHDINDTDYPFQDARALRALPCLSRLQCQTWHPGLYDYLRDCPFLTELSLKGHGQTTLDLRGTHLTRLVVDVAGVQTLYLNDNLEVLSLLNAQTRTCHMHAYADGASLQLNLPGSVDALPVLRHLAALSCSHAGTIDVQTIAAAYPHLRQLSLSGAPGTLQNLSHITACSALERLSITDLFGFSAEEVPSPAQLPHLYALWMSSVPADAAKAAKRLYKQQQLQGFNLSVEKARKPEWLAQNLDNPFRAWNGESHITAAQAKKAADLYRKARSGFLALLQSPAPNRQQAATELVRAYTEGFNRLDKSTGFIETVEREDIYTALCDILALADEHCPIEKAPLLAIFNAVREF